MFKIDSISKLNLLFSSFMVIIILFFVGITLYIDHNYLEDIQNIESVESKYLLKQKEILSNKIDRIIEYIDFTKTDIDSSLKLELKGRVNEAHSIISNLYELYKTKLNEKELKKLLLETLRPIRYYGGKGYYFIVSLDGIEQLYPVKPEFEGKNIIDLKDVKGKFVIREEINIINKKGEGFADGYWYKPNESKDSAFHKMTYVKLFKPYEWYLGSGGYLDNITNDLKKKVLNRIKKIDTKRYEREYFDKSNDRNEKNGDLIENGSSIFDGNLFVFELLKNGGGEMFAREVLTLQGFSDKESFITKNLKDNYISTSISDMDGNLFIKSLFEEMKTSGYAFGSYTDIDRISRNKIRINIFARYYPKWNWIIVTTKSFDKIDLFIEDFQKKKMITQEEEKYRFFTISGILIFIVIIVSRYISKTLNRDFNLFYKFFYDAFNSEKVIDTEKFVLSEFKTLSEKANRMITLFKESTKELENNELQFRTFINQADEFMIIKDIQGRYIKVNKRFSDLLDIPESEIVNKRPEEIGYDFEVTKDMDEIDIEIIRTKKPIIREKESVLAKKVGVKWLEESIFPILNDSGKIIYIGIVSRDITRRKIAEQNLITKHKELEEAYITLQKGKELIIKKEKLASLGTFIAGIAHEINNPAQAIKFSMNSLDLNLKEINEILQEVIKIKDDLPSDEKLKQIDRVIDKIDSLELNEIMKELEDSVSDNLESIKRIKNIITSTKRMAYDSNEFGKHSINEIVNDSLTLVNNEIKYSAVIEVELSKNIPEVTCLNQELGQVIINLLLNAKDAILEKGLSQSKGLISVKSYYDSNKKEIQVTIRDNGIGIKEKNLKKVFDPFFTTKEVGKGVGLGLNLSYQILTTHNGCIEVHSSEGEWSEFKLVLPTN